LDDTPDHDGPAKGAEKPAPQPQGIPKADAPDAKPSAAKNDGQRDDALDRAMVHWTRIVGLFTIVLAGIGGIQSWAFIQSERAAVYVNIETIIPSPLIADKPVFVAVTVFNNGRSQAFITEGITQLSFYYKIPDKPEFLKTAFNMTGAIPSQGGHRLWQLGPSEPLNWATVGEIESGNAKIVVFGKLAYVDDFTIFGPHRIGFCGIYDSQSERAKNILPVPPFSECEKPAYVYYK
jgi:hypothetical protein